MTINMQIPFAEIGPTKANKRYSIGRKAFIDIGTRFGKLIVIRRDGYTSDGKTAFLCLCDCGKQSRVDSVKLKSGHTQSCGCNAANHNKTGKLHGFNQAFHQYKVGAKRRNLSFELSAEDVEKLFSSNCFYCGDKPSSDWSGYIRNGIDRKDSSIGYTAENCVSCCAKCNYLKSDMKFDKFIELISRIAKHVASVAA